MAGVDYEGWARSSVLVDCVRFVYAEMSLQCEREVAFGSWTLGIAAVRVNSLTGVVVVFTCFVSV